MPQENIEALQRAFEAFNSGEIDRILAFVHPDFEAEVPPALSAEPDTYRGHAGVRRYFESFQEAMDEIRFEPERFWDGEERIVVAARLTARGKQTAIVVEQRFVQVWRMREGKAIAVSTFSSTREALQAAGLAHQPSLSDDALDR